MFAGGILAFKSASPLVRQGLKPLAQSSSRLKLLCCSILNNPFMNRQDACSTRKIIFCGTGILPVADKGARSQLKPTEKNESFFKPFQKSYNIKPVGIIIIHLSLFFSSAFSAV
jgi:hypothetical protein